MGSGSEATGGGVVDLRSDTVTRPSEGRRRAMSGAEMDVDGRGIARAVGALQELAAA